MLSCDTSPSFQHEPPPLFANRFFPGSCPGQQRLLLEALMPPYGAICRTRPAHKPMTLAEAPIAPSPSAHRSFLCASRVLTCKHSSTKFSTQGTVSRHVFGKPYSRHKSGRSRGCPVVLPCTSSLTVIVILILLTEKPRLRKEEVWHTQSHPTSSG